MAKQETGNRPGIGSPSLILIFIVMCLVTFGMLSLSTAKSELDFARASSELAVMAAQIAALRKYRDKK